MRKGWEYKKLGEVCDIYQPKTISTDMLSKDGEYPVYGANGVIGYYHQYNHEDKEVLLTCRGATCGNINVSKPYSWINGNAMVIHRKSEFIDFDFLKYMMLSLDYSLIITGAAQPQITRQKLAPIKIAIPPKSTQLAIVSELDKINELIRLKKEQLKDFDNLAQSLFYEMFGDPVENEKGWEVKKLGELLKVIGGYAFKSDKYKDEGIPILRIGNINSGFFRDTNLVFAESDEKLERYKIFPGDIVISLTGTVGKSDYGNVCIMDNAYNFYYLNQRNAKLEIFGNLDKYYLSAILKNEVIKSRLTSISRGVRQANIANKDIENLQIPLPPLSLQRLFAQRIEQIEREKSEVQKSIQDLETLLASRMQYWFE